MLSTLKGGDDVPIGGALQCSAQQATNKIRTTDDAGMNWHVSDRPDGVATKCICNDVALSRHPRHTEQVGGHLFNDPDKSGVVHS